MKTLTDLFYSAYSPRQKRYHLSMTLREKDGEHIIKILQNGREVIRAITKKAPIASPSFTGTPKVPTASAGTNNTQAASTAFVTSAISTAMAGITKLDFQVVQTLPSTGVKGTFYLIANSGRGQNVYDEYLWINNKYEKLGTREIDLSSYIKQSDMVAITNSEIDAAFA